MVSEWSVWGWGNFEPVHSSTPPLISFVERLRHKGLRLGSYKGYQTALSSEILRLRDAEKMTYKDMAQLLVSEGWKSPRGFSLGAESGRLETPAVFHSQTLKSLVLSSQIDDDYSCFAVRALVNSEQLVGGSLDRFDQPFLGDG